MQPPCVTTQTTALVKADAPGVFRPLRALCGWQGGGKKEAVLTERDELTEGLVALHLARVHRLIVRRDVLQPQDTAVLPTRRLRATRDVLKQNVTLCKYYRLRY